AAVNLTAISEGRKIADIDTVIAFAAKDRIYTAIAVQTVITGPALKDIIPGSAIDVINTVTALYRQGSGETAPMKIADIQHVTFCRPGKREAARTGKSGKVIKASDIACQADIGIRRQLDEINTGDIAGKGHCARKLRHNNTGPTIKGDI